MGRHDACDAGHEILDREGLRDEVDRAVLEARDLVAHLGLDGEHRDRKVVERLVGTEEQGCEDGTLLATAELERTIARLGLERTENAEPG